MNVVPHVSIFAERAHQASLFLKALSHEARLLILCHLSHREMSVGELEIALGRRQAAVSQQLARLRLDGMVATRRDGKTIYYRIATPQVQRIVSAVVDAFCHELADRSADHLY